MNHTDCRACSPIKEDDAVGVRFYATKPQLNGRTVGEYTLLCPRREDVEQSVCAGWDLGTEGKDVWAEFASTGSLRQEAAKFNGAIGFQFARLDGGAVAQKVRLAPGEEKTLDFVLSWYFPHLLSPGLPVIDYGHAYQNWFSSALEVGRKVLGAIDELLAGTKRWQEALLASNLPRWLVRKLCDDLAVLYSNTWYTRDYRFTMNESPTYMRGCLGTLDQRMASGGIFAMCFPALAEAELWEWVRQQIKEDDPQRYGLHWNCRTGRPDLLLDREGAIRHDLGWDHLEGGDYGTPGWALLHWPDLAPAFVIQCYSLAAWTGNEDFLRRVYPHLKRAMRFVARLDQNGDGVPELWGPGCCSYDNEHFPYYGASSYISSLYLAALRLAERIALRFGDAEFAGYCRGTADRVRKVLEGELWDPNRGYFISWRDKTAAAWEGGVRAHADRSENCTVAQLAGEWIGKMFGLPPGVENGRILSALRRIYELNVKPVAGCPANEVSPDGTIRSFSWAFYVEVYFACTAAYFGLADEALETLRRIDYAIHDCAGTPWDAPLVWEGPENTVPGWGRWYMSNPASWFYLHALGGLVYDALEKVLRIAPRLPTGIGDGRELKDLPIFLPGAWLKLSVRDEDRSRTVQLVVVQTIGEGWPSFDHLILDLPPGASLSTLRVETGEGKFLNWSHSPETNEIRVDPDRRLQNPGDRLRLRLSW
ncbi:MAG: hypothetical protein GX493_02690 [Firmicutes bacterium]|nr:hypothetical protein [Bacillota bacterium]